MWPSTGKPPKRWWHGHAILARYTKEIFFNTGVWPCRNACLIKIFCCLMMHVVNDRACYTKQKSVSVIVEGRRKNQKFVTNFSNLSILIKELIKVMPLVESKSNFKLNLILSFLIETMKYMMDNKEVRIEKFPLRSLIIKSFQY